MVSLSQLICWQFGDSFLNKSRNDRPENYTPKIAENSSKLNLLCCSIEHLPAIWIRACERGLPEILTLFEWQNFTKPVHSVSLKDLLKHLISRVDSGVFELTKTNVTKNWIYTSVEAVITTTLLYRKAVSIVLTFVEVWSAKLGLYEVGAVTRPWFWNTE